MNTDNKDGMTEAEDPEDMPLKIGGRLEGVQKGTVKQVLDWDFEYTPKTGRVVLRVASGTDSTSSYEANLTAKEIQSLTQWLSQVALQMQRQ